MNYRTFGTSGLRVSELCLGTMTFGEEWGWGASKGESQKIFDAFLEAGGNFIDTANVYTGGSSEKFLGEFIRQERDRLVMTSKYSYMTREGDVNAAGNHRKSLIQAVEGTLRRMDTEYLDLLWVHAWDKITPVDEVLRALNDLVSSGKVLYIGLSDTPAWVISKSNAIAELRGWNGYIGIQLEYSLIRRDVERDLLPMAEHDELGVTAWGTLGAGILTGKYHSNTEGERRIDSAEELYGELLNERNLGIASKVSEVAERFGCSPAQLAIQWVRQKHAGVIPILGARTVRQLKDNMKVLELSLDSGVMEELDKISRIDLGFPHDFLDSEAVRYLSYAGKANNIFNL